MTEGPYKLPDGWRWVRLGEVCDIIMGQSPPSRTYNLEGEGLPFYQGKADFGELFPTLRVWCSAPQKIAHPGDILISVRAPVGPTNIANRECCIGRGLAALRPKDALDRFWLLFYLKSIEAILANRRAGSTFTAITKRDLESLSLPLPPLSEQRRIVARIEELMSRIREARRLREEARQDAERLWKATLAEAFPSPGAELPPGWRWVRLGEVCKVIMGQSPSSRTYNLEGDGLPFYQGKADFGELFPTPRVWCSAPLKIAHPGDVLISVRAPVGPTNLASGECCIGRGLAALRSKDALDRFWLLFYLKSIEAMLANGGAGSTFNAITKRDLESLSLPLPPLDEQRRIVAHLEALQEKIRALKAAQSETDEDLKRIERVILDIAFKGEL